CRPTGIAARYTRSHYLVSNSTGGMGFRIGGSPPELATWLRACTHEHDDPGAQGCGSIRLLYGDRARRERSGSPLQEQGAPAPRRVSRRRPLSPGGTMPITTSAYYCHSCAAIAGMLPALPPNFVPSSYQVEKEQKHTAVSSGKGWLGVFNLTGSET